MEDAKFDEFVRLTGLGLTNQTAFQIIDGKADEIWELQLIKEAEEFDVWLKTSPSLPDQLTPLWDLDAAHFYLSSDGLNPSEFASTLKPDLHHSGGKTLLPTRLKLLAPKT